MNNASFNKEDFEKYKQDPTFLGLIQSVEEQDDRFKELPEDDKYMAMYLLVSNQADAIDGFSEVVYKRPIPTPEEFLTKRYIGQFADLIYPKWKEVFLEAFSENARTKELVLTGCIGAGKSTMAMLCHFYNLYRINSLRYPQLVMGSSPTKWMVMQLMSLSLDKAGSTLLDGIKEFLRSCKDYKEIPKRKNFKLLTQEELADSCVPWVDMGDRIVFPDKVAVRIGSRDEHGIGEDLFSVHMDEIDFKKVHSVDQVFNSYAQLTERIRSRFLGQKFTLSTLVSSITKQTGAMNKYIQGVDPNDKETTVCGFAIWEIKYPGLFEKHGYFYAMRGTRTHPSKIMEESEKALIDKDQLEAPPGCRYIKVPANYRKDFSTNIERALMNLAGVASSVDEKPFDDLTTIEDMMLAPIGEVSAPLKSDTPLWKQLPASLWINTPQGVRLARCPSAPRYMHCFTGDTEVQLINNSHKSFEELLKDYNSGVNNYTYCWNNSKGWSLGRISNVFISKKVNTVLRLTLDNGEEIKCTKDHLIMKRDGTYSKAGDLCKGDSLMPIYFDKNNIICNNTGNHISNICHTIYKTTNKLNGKFYIGKHSTNNINDGYLGSGKYITNSINKYGKENFGKEILFVELNESDAYNIERSLVTTDLVNNDLSYNLTEGGRGGGSFNFKRLWENKSFREIMSANSRKLMNNNWLNTGFVEKLKPIQARIGKINITNYNKSDNHRKTSSENCKNKKSGFLSYNEQSLYKIRSNNGIATGGENFKKKWQDSEFINKMKSVSCENGKITCELFNSDINIREKQLLGKSLKLIIEKGIKYLNESIYENCRKENFARYKRALSLGYILKRYNTFECFINEINSKFDENLIYKRNHKITKIETLILDKEIPVYDLTVDNINNDHNFTLKSGVVVHNCDLADTGEAGISMVHKERSKVSGGVMYIADFIIKVTSPNRISLESIQKFISDLNEIFAINIRKITADQYQSTGMLQFLEKNRIAEKVERLSVDRHRTQYDVLSSLISEGLFKCGKEKFLKEQLENIFIANNKPFSTPGMRKDVADTCCGSVYNAHSDQSDQPVFYWEDLSKPKDVEEEIPEGFEEL